MTTLDRMPFAARDAVFARLAQIGDLASFTKEDHRKYDASIKFYRDTMAERAYARSEGMA